MTDAGRARTLNEGELAYTSFATLADDELRRWTTHCRGLEAGEMYEWPEAESRALVEAILSSLFGAEVQEADGPARAWARSTPTMAVLARRLGCLRELFGQEGAIDGGDSAMRLAEILDRVTIVTTEAGLAELANAPLASEGEPGAAADAVAVDGASDAGATEAGAEREPDDDDRNLTSRRVSQGTAALVALAAVAAVVIVLWPSSHHPRPERAASHHGAAAPAALGAPGALSTLPGSVAPGSGSALTSFKTPALGGPATGRTVEQTVADDGTPGPSGGSESGGSSSGGTGGAPAAGGTPLPGTLPGLGGLPLPTTLPLPNSLPVPGGLPVPSLYSLPTL